MSDAQRVSEFTNDQLRFAVIDRGPINGEVVVCLHGFPQPASSWDAVITELNTSGFRVLAPTQRGYGAHACPPERRSYTIDKLARDVRALLDAADVERAHIVGHDWGGAVAWAFAATYPERVTTLTAVSTPHPGAMQRAFTHSSQGVKSWYMAMFQIPWLPEAALGARMTRRVHDGLAKGGLRDESAAASAALLANPDLARGMVNWYRALPFSLKHPIGKIDVPTLYVWSDNDHFLGRYAAQHTQDWVTGPYRFVEIAGGTHWIPDEHPSRLADAIKAIASEFPSQTSEVD